MRRTSRTLQTLVAALVALALLPFAQCASAAQDYWSAPGHDSGRNGLSPADTDLPGGSLQWDNSMGKCIAVTDPVVGANGTCYVAATISSTEANLMAIISLGRVAWSADLDGLPSGQHAVSVAVGERIIVTLGDRVAEYYANGTRAWEQALPSLEVFDVTTVLPDGSSYVAYVSSALGTTSMISRLDPSGGKLWDLAYGTEDAVTSMAALADGTLYVGSEHFLGMVYANGTLAWKASDYPVERSPVVIGPDGTLYVLNNQFLTARYPNGTVKWQFPTQEQASSSFCAPLVDAKGDVDIFVPSWIAPSSSVATPHLLSVAPNGTLAWSAEVPGQATATTFMAASADGVIYLASTDRLTVFRDDGRELWQHGFGVSKGSPAIAPSGTYCILVSEAQVGGQFAAHLLMLKGDARDPSALFRLALILFVLVLAIVLVAYFLILRPKRPK